MDTPQRSRPRITGGKPGKPKGKTKLTEQTIKTIVQATAMGATRLATAQCAMISVVTLSLWLNDGQGRCVHVAVGSDAHRLRVQRSWIVGRETMTWLRPGHSGFSRSANHRHRCSSVGSSSPAFSLSRP